MAGSTISVYENVGEIIKSNYLIEAKYDLSLNEQKLVLMAIGKINSASRKRNIVTIRVREFCNLIGSSTERYTEMRELLRELRKKEIIITMYDSHKEIKEELIAGWIDTAHYKSGTGEVDLEFSDKLMPYLVELSERYTVYNYLNIAHLSSKHAIRMYELMKEYEYKKGTVFKYDRLKELICGSDKFERYYDFKKRVLLPAQVELKNKTDICFEFEEIRSGKKLEAIEFKVYKNNEIVEKRELQSINSQRLRYYGESEIVNVIDRYMSKSKEELIDELHTLIEENFDASFNINDLKEYSEKTLMRVIFGIVDGNYINVEKPIPYFKTVLKKEEEQNACQ